MLPFDWSGTAFVLVNLALGFGFGFTLERAGFGDSRRLAAQFYFRDLTVLKVMFTAIVVAMLLLLWAGAFGWIDPDRVHIDTTYFGPGIVGGFMVGLGFIIGGYCPGTSMVAAANLKIDGMLFVAGLLFGIFVFGGTVSEFWDFFNKAGYHGSFTLDQLLGVSKGMAAVLVTMMAVFAFWGAEKLEAGYRRKKVSRS